MKYFLTHFSVCIPLSLVLAISPYSYNKIYYNTFSLNERYCCCIIVIVLNFLSHYTIFSDDSLRYGAHFVKRDKTFVFWFRFFHISQANKKKWEHIEFVFCLVCSLSSSIQMASKRKLIHIFTKASRWYIFCI